MLFARLILMDGTSVSLVCLGVARDLKSAGKVRQRWKAEDLL
jgi:hypothetical protein